MEQGYSLFNPGGSLNFEMPASFIQNDNEEDEAAEDERIKEKELQALLTNAFDDLIEDDDEGSLMLSPTQNSIHSDGSTSVNFVITNAEKRPTNKPNYDRFPQIPVPLEMQLPHQKENAINDETNGGFQQMEPETYDSEASGDYDRNGMNLHKNHVDSDWEGRYYVDHWNGQSDDQLQSGPLDNVSNDSPHENMPQLPNSAQNGNQERIFAYHPYPFELNGQNTVEYNPQTEEKTENLIQKHFQSLDGETSDQIKMQQLQILYNARGREIHRLQQDLDRVMDKMTKESDALKQHLVVSKKEAEKNVANFQKCQKELSLATDAISNLEGQLRATEMQLGSVTANRNEVIQKLQAADSTIESLHVKIEELQNSESLNRARQNHAAMLTTLQENHNQETYKLKVEIDATKQALQIKEEKVEQLMGKLDRVTAECEKIKLDKAESVNKLLVALEESQKECHKLVSSAKAANTWLTQQSDNKNDEIIQSLKNELASVKQELDLYISANNIGIETQKNDSVKKCFAVERPNEDSLLTALKLEVERALNCLQSKNEQLQKYQANYEDNVKQLKAVQESLNSVRYDYSQAQLKVTELSKELQTMKKEAELNDRCKEFEMIQRQMQEKDNELHQVKQNVEQLSTSNQQLTAHISKLKDEIKQLIQRHDEDKLRAVKECQEACLQLHNDVMKVKQDELEQRLKQVQNEHDNAMAVTIHELDEVKNLYVKVCEEKNQLEQVLEELKMRKQKEIIDITNHCASLAEQNKTTKKDFEKKLKLIENQKLSFSEDLFNARVQEEVLKQVAENLKQAKKTWLKEQELETEEKISAKARELLELHMSEKGHDSYDATIDNYLEQIQELEKRVKEAESLYKQNLSDLEKEMNQQKTQELKDLEDKLLKQRETLITDLMKCKDREIKAALNEMERKFVTEKQILTKELKEAKVGQAAESLKNQLHAVSSATAKQHFGHLLEQFEAEKEKILKDAAIKVEEEKCRAVAEVELKKELILKEQLEALSQTKEKEKEIAIRKKEEQLCSELEAFLAQQKQRFLTILKAMQESHNKEKVELQQKYETKISQLSEEYQKSVDSQQQQMKQSSQYQQQTVTQERDKLEKLVKVLETKCRQTEVDMQDTITGLNRQLAIKDMRQEEEVKRCEELSSALAKSQEANDVLKHEVAALRTKAQESEELDSNYQNLLSKYTMLKEKVKKYHRYIHGKEKEFAANLAKITEEHKTALEKVTSMKNEVTSIMNKRLDEIQYQFMQALVNRALSPMNLKRTIPTDTPGDFQDNVKSDKTAEMDSAHATEDWKEWFSKLIQKIHADAILYFEECNRTASAKIQEEVAKASWLLSEHIRNPSFCNKKETLRSDVPLESRDYVTPHGNQISTLDGLTISSSGRGTMVGAPSSSLSGNPDAASHEKLQTVEKDLGCNEHYSLINPVKFWSSTPFTQEFTKGPKWPILRPSPGLSREDSLQQNARIRTVGSGLGENPLQASKPDDPCVNCNTTPATLTPNVFSHVTCKSVDNLNPLESAIPEKLCPVQREKLQPSLQQVLRQSQQHSAARLESEKRKTHFIDFSNNLSSLKSDFWSNLHESKNDNVNRNNEIPIE